MKLCSYTNLVSNIVQNNEHMIVQFMIFQGNTCNGMTEGEQRGESPHLES